MFLKRFITLFILSYSLSSQAQVLDTIRASFNKRPGLTGGFSTRQTFIDVFKAPVLSAKIGVDFNNKVRMGGGISFLKDPYLSNRYVTDQGLTFPVKSSLHFQYFHYYFEYVYYKTKKWEFSVPIELGLGRTFNTYEVNSEKFTENKRIVFVYQPVVTGYYRFTYWFGIGADVGYRFLLTGDKKNRQTFSAPVYAFNTIIFWGALYKKFFPETRLAKRI